MPQAWEGKWGNVIEGDDDSLAGDEQAFVAEALIQLPQKDGVLFWFYARSSRLVFHGDFISSELLIKSHIYDWKIKSLDPFKIDFFYDFWLWQLSQRLGDEQISKLKGF